MDRKIVRFTNRAGLPGYGIWLKLLEKIYRADGYYMPFDYELRDLFVAEVNYPAYPVDLDVLDEVLNHMFICELFDRGMYEEFEILTSRGIQKRYIFGAKRRKSIDLIKEYMLIDVDKFIDEELGKISPGINMISVSSEESSVVSDDVDKTDEDVDNPQSDVDNSVDNDYKKKMYDRFVQAWNEINDANIRLTKKKKQDIDRAMEHYSEFELMWALKIRARSQMLKDAHRRDWNTFFGRKKMEAVDKWVDRAMAIQAKQEREVSFDSHINEGWWEQARALKECAVRGIELDHIYFDIKIVEGKKLYKPNFSV